MKMTDININKIIDIGIDIGIGFAIIMCIATLIINFVTGNKIEEIRGIHYTISIIDGHEYIDRGRNGFVHSESCKCTN